MSANSAILAIDLGKYKSVACAQDRTGSAPRFETLTTSRHELRRLLTRHRPSVVVFEACTLAGWVSDLRGELGTPCRVANTASEAWKFKHARRKTDKDDALRLAQLEALGQLPTVSVPPIQTRQWRALIACRQRLVGLRVRAQNRVRSLLVAEGLPCPRGHRAWTESGLQGLDGHAKALDECGPDELWRGALRLALGQYRQAREQIDQVEAKPDALARQDEGVRLLQTIPGVGPRTAEAVVAQLHQPGRFDSGKQVSAYAGLVPRQYQSGESDRRGRITKRGPGLLRKMLVECAWVMPRCNPWARQVYQRLSRGQARKKQAIVALARKLLVRCWAMLRDRTAWREAPAAEAAPA